LAKKNILNRTNHGTTKPAYYAGIFIVAMSTLLLEFTLTRVLSVSLWYHFAFMIISVALLGFGISGVTIIISSRINKAEINSFLTVTSLLYAVSIVLSFVVLNKLE